MLIDQYGYALLGGLIIGLSASLLLLFNGRVAGISGIFWRSIVKIGDGSFLFILGLPLGAWLFHAIAHQPYPAARGSFGLAVIGGLLVGIGVKLGSGCTSGHGVCGIGRLSKRSILATITFMGMGIFTVFLIKEVIA